MIQDTNQSQCAFANDFSAFAQGVHAIAKSKGWWDTDRPVTEALVLIHCEVSECVEALRQGNKADRHLPQYKEFDVELADIVIRVMDLSAKLGIDLGAVIKAKVEYNRSRPHKHGKQF
jgi:NTP pyrophosphatase (non-canonical NTP hydrolase)